MSAQKFKFVSPGVFLNEIDNSQLPREAPAIGPIIIGRASQGPALQPVRVESMAEFIETFGNPLPGGNGDDVWREGNGFLAPSYASYAVQAYLRNSAPVNFVRLLGVQHPSSVAEVGEAGYGKNQQAYALLVGKEVDADYDGTKAKDSEIQSSVAAIFYTDASHDTISIRASGVRHSAEAASTSSCNGVWVDNTADSGDPTFTIKIDKVGGATAAKATATIVVGDSGGILNGETFTLVDHNNTSTVYTINAGTAPAAGGGSGGTATVGYQGIGGGADGKVAAANAIAVAINATTDAAYTAASNGVDTVTITQGKVGTIGDKTNSDSISSTTVSNFTGGQGVASQELITFNFNRNSDKFIRKVFNTNPTSLTAKTAAAGAAKRYWLGESFETYVNENVLTNRDGTAGTFSGFSNAAGTGSYCCTVVRLRSNGTNSAADFRLESSEAKTGWFFSQQVSQDATEKAAYLPANMQKLFKFHGLGYGESLQRRFKVSIQDIKAPAAGSVAEYGSFTVVIRDIRDTDAVPRVVEKFSNCNLNPQSSNYIAKKIGDTFTQYDSAAKRNRSYGNYPNISRYVRVEMNSDIDNGSLSPVLLPFGYYGPPVRKSLKVKTEAASAGGNTVFKLGGATPSDGAAFPETLWLTISSGSTGASKGTKGDTFTPYWSKVEVDYPKLSLRLSASEGNLADPTDAYFGLRTTRGASSEIFDAGVIDHLRRLPAGLTAEQFPSAGLEATKVTAPSFFFSLDEVISNDKGTYYLSGSRATGESKTGKGGFRAILDAGFDRFTAPLYGGFDGVDITEQDPFNNRVLNDSTNGTPERNYAIASVERAIDLVSDPEVIECNLMSVPGLTKASLTKKVIDTCEARSDALAVIDLPDVYVPPHEERYDTFKERAVNSLSTTVKTFEQRALNSSYGCTYYPWVMVYDEINDRNVWVPPSVIALGVFANTERREAVWFAPAGFNRGGLTEGSAGLPVLNVSEKLSSADRDKLYDANINPIASFPAEGIVVFGQKTLQVTPSALDRINVRRLMIFVKKQISRIANNLLFDQNVQTTWLRFVSEVKPFLEGVKLGFGLSDFAVVLDNSTTTPDLVDRNIMYAKIFLKPARAIEFIAVDFVITNTGAAFED